MFTDRDCERPSRTSTAKRKAIPAAVLPALTCVLYLMAAVPGRAGAGAGEAKSIFKKRCTACHTFGKGIKVGPDLKGVTERRGRTWLLGFVDPRPR
jgi:protein SCO1/2